VRTVRGLKGFRFESLSHMFLARTLRDDLSPFRLMIANRAHKLRRCPRKGVMGRKARSFSDQAFARFNRRAYRALARLSGQMHDETRGPYHATHISALLSSATIPARFLTSLAGATEGWAGQLRADALTTLLIGNIGQDDNLQDAA
jgi:hypothetical protein